MSRKVVPLEPEHLAALGPHVRECLTWQRPRGWTAPDAAAAAAEKVAWLREVRAQWGSPGRVVVVDDEPVAVAVYAPEAWLPGASAYPTSPVSPDAVLLAGLYVDPQHRGGGLARLLVQRAARDVVERRGAGAGALEAFADTRGGHGCLLPLEVWERLGFRVHRAHVTTPRVRMDLRTTVTWRGEVGQAWGRLVGAVRPRPQPARGVRGAYGRGPRALSPAGRTAR